MPWPERPDLMPLPTSLSSEFLSAIIERLAHPVFVKDREFRFVLVNSALCEMVGYGRDELLGKTDFDFFPDEEAAFFRSKDEELFNTGATIDVEEERITDASGVVHILATTKVPQRNAQGDITHVVGIISDITRVKLAEESLRQAKGDLERRVAERSQELAAAQQELLRKERLAVLGHLAGGLAHQLRNPLAAIQNAVALVNKGSLDDSQKQALDIIAEEVVRADRTITGLLEYARVRPPELREVPLRHVVELVVDLERPPDAIVLEIVDEQSVAGLVDPLQLQLALGNVVRNSIDAMADGGNIRIELDVDDGWARITVRDDGCGVPEQARASLFEPLVTTKPLGVGLGLSTARNLLENQRGTIRYRPGAAGGSVFVIHLPLAQRQSTRC